MDNSIILEEANRCLQCKNPTCTNGCPINTKIPEVIRLFKEDKINEAGEILFLNNPLSSVCALVCDHEKQCLASCVLNKAGKPVRFYEIERYISANYIKQVKTTAKPVSAQKIAIIGSGPAGLAAAVYLSQYGYKITIYESKKDVGGMLRYGIPDFRLPKSLLDDFKETQLNTECIEIKTDTTIGEAITIDDLLEDCAAVLIAAGLWKATPLNIKGENLRNVYYGVDYLSDPAAYELGDNLIVIGAGNSAMDVARTAKRRAVKKVTCYARRNVSRSNIAEIEAAISEGIEFAYSKMPVEIKKDAVIFADTYTNEENRAVKIENTDKLYPYSSVIISVSQCVLGNFLSGLDIETDSRGYIKSDKNGRTNIAGLFVAGDVSGSGGGTVVGVVAQSKIVAQAIHDYIQNRAS